MLSYFVILTQKLNFCLKIANLNENMMTFCYFDAKGQFVS